MRVKAFINVIDLLYRHMARRLIIEVDKSIFDKIKEE